MPEKKDDKPTPLPRRTKRGRPTKAEAEEMDKILANLKPGDVERMAKERREFEELKRYQEELPTDPNMLWDQACWFLANEVWSVIEAGRRLIVLKQVLGHGAYMAGLEDRGIPYRTAYRAMKACQRFSNLTALSNLNSRDKLYALLEIPEEELKELESGGTVLGKTVDEINLMTTRELRDLVRRQKEELRRKDEQIIKGQDQVHTLERKVVEATKPIYTGDEVKLIKRLRSNMLSFEAILLDTLPRGDEVLHVSLKTRMEWLGFFDFMHKRALLACLDARASMDPEGVGGFEIDNANKEVVRGTWEERGGEGWLDDYLEEHMTEEQREKYRRGKEEDKEPN